MKLSDRKNQNFTNQAEILEGDKNKQKNSILIQGLEFETNRIIKKSLNI